MRNDLKAILKFASVQGNPSVGAPFGTALRQTLDWFLARATAYGFKTENLDGYCGYAEWGSGKQLVGILCHLDVVPAGEGWSVPPYDLTEQNGYLMGRGVVDNKGPAIVLLHVLKKLKDEGFVPRHRVRLIVGCNEETGGACMRHYTKHAEIPMLSIVPDADFPAICSEKGILHVKLSLPVSDKLRTKIASIRFGNRANVVPDYAEAKRMDGGSIAASGRAGHAMCPEKADNAAWKLMEKLSEFSECAAIKKTLCCHDGATLNVKCCDEKSGALTMNLGAGDYENGGAFNLTLDFRLPLCIQKEAVLDALKAAFPTAAVAVLHHQDNLYLEPDSPLVQTVLGVYEAVTGQNAVAQQTGGGTYARLLPNSIAFGPTFPNTETFIHDVDERIATGQFSQWFDIYYAAVKKLCGIETSGIAYPYR